MALNIDGLTIEQIDTLTVTPEINDMLVTGVGVSIDADPGSYTATGADVGFLATNNHFLAADHGTYSTFGRPIIIYAKRWADALPGSYAMTGYQTTFPLEAYVPTVPGFYMMTGGQVAVAVGRTIPSADPGSYATTGSQVILSKSMQPTSASGEYLTTGYAAGFVFDGELPERISVCLGVIDVGIAAGDTMSGCSTCTCC